MKNTVSNYFQKTKRMLVVEVTCICVICLLLLPSTLGFAPNADSFISKVNIKTLVPKIRSNERTPKMSLNTTEESNDINTIASDAAATTDILNGYQCSQKSRERFSGKNVLLTGASGGLGKALAAHLASCGVSTLVLSGRDEEALKAVAKICEKIASEKKSSDVSTSDSKEMKVQSSGSRVPSSSF